MIQGQKLDRFQPFGQHIQHYNSEISCATVKNRSKWVRYEDGYLSINTI